MTRQVKTPVQDILQILYQNGDLSSTNLKTLKAYIKRWSRSPLMALLETRILAEETLANALSRHLKLERVSSVADVTISEKILQLVPFSFARQRVCIPIAIDSSKTKVTIVTADPTDAILLENLDKNLKSSGGKTLTAKLAIGEYRDVLSAINQRYPLGLQIQSSTWSV